MPTDLPPDEADPGHPRPRRRRAAAGDGQGTSATEERLLRAAADLLGEIGFERLTTNAIAARAGLTPPALYRYFRNKYEMIELLGRRLLQQRTDAFAAWVLAIGTWPALDRPEDVLADWFRFAAETSADQPYRLWIMRAMRAFPELAHVRHEMLRTGTEQLFQLYRRHAPRMAPDRLWARLRVAVEVSWMVDELLLEEPRIPRAVLFAEVARVFGRAVPPHPRPKPVD